MAYSSRLTDQEWERLEPLLLEVLPPQNKLDRRMGANENL